MSLKIVHISDTHGKHEQVKVPPCDILIHTGDIGGRTGTFELTQFLVWFEKQPATKKIWIAGNHDICLDPKWPSNLKSQGRDIEALLARQHYSDAMSLIESYDVKYLVDKEHVYQGIKFYGSPYSPSFHRSNWVFNADRGQEIRKIWSKIPSDVHVLMTHSPVYQILDLVEDKYRESQKEDMNVGCQDLLEVIKKRLFNLKLVAGGHIHDQYGVILGHVSTNRRCLFSNGAVLNNDYKILVPNPLIITI